MKKIILIVLSTMFAFAGVAVAGQKVTFSWADDSAATPTGYRLFIRTQDGDYNYKTPSYDGIDKTDALELDNGQYAAVVRAYIGNNESENSNEIQFTVSDIPAPIVVPGRPSQLIIKFE
jgi:hypothetical protein